jgi:hypothetical protein
MSRIRLVLSSLTGAAVAGTLAFGIGSASAQPSPGRAATCSIVPGPTPLELCMCPDGSTGYCSLGKCICDS